MDCNRVVGNCLLNVRCSPSYEFFQEWQCAPDTTATLYNHEPLTISTRLEIANYIKDATLLPPTTAVREEWFFCYLCSKFTPMQELLALGHDCIEVS